MRYVALGDSYTVGTAVADADRWPDQLARRIGDLELVANLGVDGATSAELIGHQLALLDQHRPELVSVLIGANDVVQGVPDGDYAHNVAAILDHLVGRVGSSHIVVVAIPDATVAPRWTEFGDPVEQSDAILRFNAIMREACEQRAVRFVPEVFEISREAVQGREPVAADGFHPSGAQYERWVDAIEPVVRSLLDA